MTCRSEPRQPRQPVVRCNALQPDPDLQPVEAVITADVGNVPVLAALDSKAAHVVLTKLPEPAEPLLAAGLVAARCKAEGGCGDRGT